MSFMFPEHDFSALSLEDLLAAREIFHVQLADKKNVIATALGRYLIRRADPWPKGKQNLEQIHGHRRKKGKRTLENSEIRPYSWPCILVFVEKWEDPADFGKDGLEHDDMVPRSVALPNGKRVPVCVVEAKPELVTPSQPVEPVLPSHLIGGGYPLVAKVQHQTHFASVGCLVTDGHLTYALTSRHVTGEPGEVVFGAFNGKEPVRVGTSAKKRLGRMRFCEIYPEWQGTHVYCNLDIGLVTLDDIRRWTPRVFKIGQLGPLVDIRNGSVLFRLLGCAVSAFGCAGRKMQGQVQALFYRYKSLGGFDYVADFLIGPKPGGQLTTQRGDSGTIWVLNSSGDEGFPPLCVQWGGHVFQGSEGERTRSPYALATALSTVCNLLEISIVRDWDIDHPEFWGEMGHYVIGAKACDLVTDPKLSHLMKANQDRIGFKDKAMSDPDQFRIHTAHYNFVPLADVADDVWRLSRIGGNNHPDVNNDGNNHFADMDQRATAGPHAGKTLMDLFDHDPKSVDADVWLKFYESLGEAKLGALPFRVWQAFNAMVEALNAPNGPDFLAYVCVAGCMAHYVGDACQPLHVSRLHHGFPPLHSGNVAYNVHSVYETDMPNLHAGDIVNGLRDRIHNWNGQFAANIADGRGAAIRTVQLMKKTIQTISPEELVNTYNAAHTPGERLERLWTDFGQLTIDCMFEGCLCMAEIWQSAWALGPASLAQLPATQLKALPKGKLSTLYRKSNFLPSASLSIMKAWLH
jgi:hypothetical protein